MSLNDSLILLFDSKIGNQMIQIKHTFLLITLIFITSCGYHLRGSMDLPSNLKNIYLLGGSGQLHKVFKRTLKTSKGKLVHTTKDADVVVEIIEEDMDRRVLSLSQTGRVNEFELLYTLRFLFLDNKGQALSKKQEIEISRDYFNNQEEVLGKNNEEKTIKKEMYRQAVQSIVRRLSIALKKAKSK